MNLKKYKFQLEIVKIYNSINRIDQTNTELPISDQLIRYKFCKIILYDLEKRKKNTI